MDGPATEQPPAPATDPAQDAGGPQTRLTQFQDQLATKAPTPLLTYGIIGANAAVFLAMLVTGVSLMNPDVKTLLAWGGNLGSATTSGQWWRLFTCMFLHIGLIHILFNMFVLWDIGRFIERLLGPAGLAVVYVLAGLSGSIASMWWNPFVVSAGASGAIFGLYGCLLGYLLAESADVPVEVARRLQKNALVFLGYNLIWGLVHRGTDMAGHLGGLAGGLACGFALAHRLKSRGPAAKPRILFQVAAAGLAILVLAAASRPRTVDLQQELARFSATESKVQASYNQAVAQARAGHLTDLEFARSMDADVIPPWHAARLRLEGLHGLPEPQALLLARIGRYAETRERGWVVFSEALRQHDPEGVQRAATLHGQADQLLKDLSR